MVNYKQYFILILVFLLALNAKGKNVSITKVYELNKKNYNLEQRDTTLNISLNIPFISIGDDIYVGSKRYTYSSLEDYIIYDEFQTKDACITFQYNPNTGDILTVVYEGIKTFYYRP